MEISKETWNEILQSVKKEFDVTDVAFRTWLQPLEVHGVRDNTVIILVPTGQMGIDYISKKYVFPLKVAVAEITGTEYEIGFILPEEAKEENLRNGKSLRVELPGGDPKVNMSLLDAGLNPKYTFENFVVGSNNKFAHSAAVAVAESPGRMYNPLFIYGGPGLGKTHLMHAIAGHIISTQPEKTVRYVSSETFTNELIDALRNSNNISLINGFRHRYRNIDILLIDDIQFIIGKESTQEEFFHTFNDLYQHGKHIVLTSDKPPKDMETLPKRLKSRFSEGMICDIQIPSYETKRAILDQKIEDRHLHNIPNGVRDYIANNVKSSIRELEGSINTLQAYVDLNNSDMTLDVAKEALKDYVSPEHNKVISTEYIIDIVSEHYGVTVSDILSTRKSTEITFPRQVVMYLCRQMTAESAEEIGKAIGGRDHSTIIHGIKKVTEEYDTNETTRTLIETIKKKINPN